jgi:hypothetical protein
MPAIFMFSVSLQVEMMAVWSKRNISESQSMVFECIAKGNATSKPVAGRVSQAALVQDGDRG